MLFVYVFFLVNSLPFIGHLQYPSIVFVVPTWIEFLIVLSDLAPISQKNLSHPVVSIYVYSGSCSTRKLFCPIVSKSFCSLIYFGILDLCHIFAIRHLIVL